MPLKSNPGGASVPASHVPSPALPNPPCLLTRRELAGVLQISVRTVDRLVSAGQLPCRRFGRTVRFHLPDVLTGLAPAAGRQSP